MTVIKTNRFDANRERLADQARNYQDGMRELNASYPEQLDATRGPDPMGDDLVTVIATLVIGSLVVMAFVWGIVS